MKKNRTMRIAAVMLVLALLTTCIISGSFAKYVTNGGSSDSARVALWGVEVIATSNTAFGSIYKSADGTINTTYTAGTDSVNGNGDKVVAPGTTGSVASISLTGQPEVKCEVTCTPTITLSNWSANGTEYCPIIFTVNGETYGTNVTNATNKYATVALLKAGVESAIGGYSASYEARALLDDVDALSISWEWPFRTGATDDAKAENDIKDTALASSGATISIDVSIKVEQLD